MRVIQSPLFARKVKKMRKNEKAELDNQIKKIIANPTIGEGKKADLKGVFVHKFKLQSTVYLLAYRFRKDSLELITFGPHENYYRDLKTYLKSR